jgi:putative ABC transport system substrate-binding protein
MRRREFITLLGGAATMWPLTARAQQPAMPVVGFLHPATPESQADRLRAFRNGLKEAGFVEGENVAVAYRWAENQGSRLPELAADLVRRQVGMIVTPTTPTAVLAARATTTIPVVFAIGDDPVRLGLVAAVARPGGNVTGINYFNAEVAAKRLEFLRELVPSAVRLAVMVNPDNPNADAGVSSVTAAARAMGLQVQVVNATTPREINTAFVGLVQERPDALFVLGDALFHARRVQLVTLAAHHRLPATYSVRENVEAGGLMSYGTNVADAWRQAALYVGRILKGAKPADLPVVQASKFELVINAETATMLGLTVPPSLLAIADEVIE